jgi:hypothetical protein
MAIIDDPDAEMSAMEAEAGAPTLGPEAGLSPILSQVMGADQQAIPREEPDPPEQRKKLVTAWSGRVKTAKGHWDKAFKRMREDQDFAWGMQWSKEPSDKRYKANLTLRLVAQKTAFLYAKNPKAVARRRERLNATLWNETESQLQQIVQTGGMMAQQAATGGGMLGSMMGGGAAPPGMNGGMPPGMPPNDPSMMGGGAVGPGGMPPGMTMQAGMAGMVQAGMAISQDALRVKQENEMLDKLGRTLELLYSYNVAEQVHPFKSMMKLTVRRAITTGVGYVKLGFERVMERRPDKEKGIADASERLATLERLSADMADEITEADSKEAEQLKLLIQDMSQQVEFMAREGLTFDYPLATNIIPDTKCVELRHFLGTDWVAEEFMLSPNDIKEIYGVDVGDSYTSYKRWNMSGPDPIAMAREMSAGAAWSEGRKSDDRQNDFCCVWEIYSRKDGLVYIVCDGHKDFLREPTSPEVYNERFYPWYALIFNECDHETEIFPPSDVRLMRDMQLEYNRCREGLKEQRIAARPFTAVVAGSMDEEDMLKLEQRDANALIELAALQPNQDIKNLLQPYAGAGIDPNLYEVNPVYEDVLRTTGIQEANLGGTSDTTATQAQIAEGSRMTSMGSNIDDLNDLLTQLARNGGQMLLAEVSKATVEKIVGQGCIWPELARQDIAQEVLLEIEAGSMGRPNATQEVATAQRIYPLLMQLPGINPEFLAKDLLRRMDDRLDLTQAFKSQLPSIVAMNGAMQTAPGAGEVPGAAQGPQGASNGSGPPAQPPGGPPDMAGQLAGVAPPGASGAMPG